MAYMNQDKKKVIAAELKKVVPASWKYSLRVDNHSQLTINISKADVPASDIITDRIADDWDFQLNHFYPENVFQGKSLEIVRQIIDAMNTGNWDKSDSQTDYFNVGHYIGVTFRQGVLNSPVKEEEEVVVVEEQTEEQTEVWVIYNEDNNRILSVADNEKTAESEATFWTEEEDLENVAWTTKAVFNVIESQTAILH